MSKPHQMNRRHVVLGLTAALGAGMGLSPIPAFAGTRLRRRKLGFLNTHTGERLDFAYRPGHVPATETLTEIRTVLRDHRNGKVGPFDPRILDFLYQVHAHFDSAADFHVISGYRSPETNAMLARRSSGVARKSLHMVGKAIDVRLPGTDARHLYRAARAMGFGGTGLYTASDFVHLDTGRVRFWGR